MPSAESGGVMNMWYSFNYKNVHFVNINTGEPLAAHAAQTDDPTISALARRLPSQRRTTLVLPLTLTCPSCPRTAVLATR